MLRSGWFLRTCLMIMLLAASLFAVRPMVTYRAIELEATTTQIGLLAASYGLLSFMVAIPAGRLADRFGEARFMIAGASIMGTMSLSLYFADSLLTLAVSQAVLGAAHITCLVALQRMVASGGEPSEREGRFGLFSVFASSGQVIGPAMGGFVAAAAGGSAAVVFLVSASILGLAIINATSLQLRPPPNWGSVERSHGDDSSIFQSVARVLSMRSMPQAMAASITALVAIDLLVAYLPAFGEANGIPVATIGLLLSIRAAASGLSRLIMLRVINRFGRKQVFIGSLLLPALAILAMPAFPDPVILAVLMSVVGFGLGFGQPMSISFVAGVSPPHMRGIALGVRLSGNRVGQVVLPAAVGLVGGASGISAVFVALAMLMTATSLWLTNADFETVVQE